jgi:hypothetical protein
MVYSVQPTDSANINLTPKVNGDSNGPPAETELAPLVSQNPFLPPQSRPIEPGKREPLPGLNAKIRDFSKKPPTETSLSAEGLAPATRDYLEEIEKQLMDGDMGVYLMTHDQRARVVRELIAQVKARPQDTTEGIDEIAEDVVDQRLKKYGIQHYSRP